MFAAASEYILLSLNFFEIIINLTYLALYFANISFGVVLNSSSSANNSGANNQHGGGQQKQHTNNAGEQQPQKSTDEDNDQGANDYLKYHNRSSAWLTIIDDRLADYNQAAKENSGGETEITTAATKAAKNKKNGKTTKFAIDQIDNASTLTHNRANNKGPFYKTLPKTFGRHDATDKNKANALLRVGSLHGSQESLKNAPSSSSSSSSSSLHTQPPNRPPPPPPRKDSLTTFSGGPSTTTGYGATGGGGAAPSREQMFISLLSSIFGFFSAKFRLNWLLLFYSMYMISGVVMWLYNHAYIYRRVRRLSYPEQDSYARRSAAPKAAGLIVSAPSQSLGLSSALDLTQMCSDMFDEVHLQMLASRRDVVDMGLKLLLTMSAYDLSNSL